jgi:ribosomal protein S18 acetylase RimI-like enzyme
MRVREYSPADLEACLAVFDTNVPRYFAPFEKQQFAGDIPSIDCYYVIEDDGGRIVGCGGYAVRPEASTADLCWGMIDQTLHGTGLGRLLLVERLERIRSRGDVDAVALNTSQHTTGFFERHGFVILKIIPDGYAPGLDRCEMVLKL